MQTEAYEITREEEARVDRPGWSPTAPPTTDTVLKYIKCVGSLLRCYEREALDACLSDRVEFMSWFLVTQEPRVKTNTWRFQRAALFHVLENEYREDSDEALGLLARHERTGEMTARSSVRSKRKRLPEDEHIDLISELQAAPSDYKYLTIEWLQLTLDLGLRPVEVGTTLEEISADGEVVIVVRNAKATQGRGGGGERRLGLREFAANDQARIRTFLRKMRNLTEAGHYQTIYESCRKLLLKASRRLWPERKTTYSLYSARHQFCANTKSQRETAEVSVGMGHSSERTAIVSYGKRRHGKKVPLPTVSADAVNLVRPMVQRPRPRGPELG